MIDLTGYPPRPWTPETEPDLEELAAWVALLSPDQLCPLLARWREGTAAEARCFLENHAGLRSELAAYQQRTREELQALAAEGPWKAGYEAGYAEADRRWKRALDCALGEP